MSNLIASIASTFLCLLGVFLIDRSSSNRIIPISPKVSWSSFYKKSSSSKSIWESIWKSSIGFLLFWGIGFFQISYYNNQVVTSTTKNIFFPYHSSFLN